MSKKYFFNRNEIKNSENLNLDQLMQKSLHRLEEQSIFPDSLIYLIMIIFVDRKDWLTILLLSLCMEGMILLLVVLLIIHITGLKIKTVIFFKQMIHLIKEKKGSYF